MTCRFAVAVLVALHIVGCSRDDAAQLKPTPADDQLPGPLPGWERQFDGISCKHPAVEASCAEGWCRVPGGCFIKGSPEEEPGHPAYVEAQRAVTLTRGFWVQQYEVTQEQWTALGLHDPSTAAAAGGGDCTHDKRCPVGNVTWFEVVAFANLLSQAHKPPLAPCYELVGCATEIGHGMRCESATLTAATIYACEGYRMLTDAEYEYAVRAGTTTAFYAGEFDAGAADPPTHPPRRRKDAQRLAPV
jgi:formylglycine-generating enzyme required for sulfatase activity